MFRADSNVELTKCVVNEMETSLLLVLLLVSAALSAPGKFVSFFVKSKCPQFLVYGNSV